MESAQIYGMHRRDAWCNVGGKELAGAIAVARSLRLCYHEEQ